MLEQNRGVKSKVDLHLQLVDTNRNSRFQDYQLEYLELEHLELCSYHGTE